MVLVLVTFVAAVIAAVVSRTSRAAVAMANILTSRERTDLGGRVNFMGDGR